ncbi:GNAT family N-acetyltransferase [Streptomyces sp. NPDC004327]|uniref:GNAT family N-acetyltransferase n=1 Tax=Streptomyces sp. NPDC004327 TaxID=3364699 RepID=UPI0036BCCE1B
MRDEVKLCDGVVVLTLLDPSLAPAGPGAAPRPDDLPERWRPHGPALTFAIRAGRPVGTLELRPAAAGFAGADADLAFTLNPDARGRGFATRAVLLACDHARTEGARRAVILTPAGRTEAAAVARRAGFTRRGQISHADGTLSDWHVRALAAP